MIPVLADVALSVVALPFVAAAGYLLLLALLSRRRAPPRAVPPRHRFDLIVPAHDEEGGIAATVASLLGVDYPPELMRVIVVADNCGDATAERARAAGATVLARQDAERRGKGYALAHAFERSLADGFADAVVVVDADSVVSRNLLRAFAARLDAGALAAQAHYGVRNAGDSWRTRLMGIAFALFHTVRSTARERLGCSCGLRGNGMCFTVRLLRDHPHDAFSVVEDVEYGIRIGVAGHRVHYAAEAEVLGDMVSSAAASRTQRRRWEGGRRQMIRNHALPLLARGLRTGDRVKLDLAADLLVPPLARLCAAAVAGLWAATLASWMSGRVLVSAWLWGACAVSLGLYVLRGVWVSGMGLRGLGSLVWAPVYAIWKVGLAVGGEATVPGAWVRTSRERRP